MLMKPRDSVCSICMIIFTHVICAHTHVHTRDTWHMWSTLSACCDVLPWNHSWSWLSSWVLSCMPAAPLLANFCLSASACFWLSCLSAYVHSEFSFSDCVLIPVSYCLDVSLQSVCLTESLLFMAFFWKYQSLENHLQTGNIWEFASLPGKYNIIDEF